MPKTKKRSIYDRFTWHEDNDHCDATFFLLDRIGDAIYDPPTLPPQCVADAASALFGDAPGDFQRDSRAAFALHDIINAAIASTLMDLANGNQSAWDALRDRVEIDRSNRRRELVLRGLMDIWDEVQRDSADDTTAEPFPPPTPPSGPSEPA